MTPLPTKNSDSEIDCYDLAGSFSIHAGHLSQLGAGENGPRWLWFLWWRYSSLLMSLLFLTVISTEISSIVSISLCQLNAPNILHSFKHSGHHSPNPAHLLFSTRINETSAVLLTDILGSFLGIVKWTVPIYWDTLQVEGGWLAPMNIPTFWLIRGTLGGSKVNEWELIMAYLFAPLP